MNLYFYSGPVLEFEKIVADHWESKTYAVSETKARSNLAFQFKKETGRVPKTKITLPGKIKKEEDVTINERACL